MKRKGTYSSTDVEKFDVLLILQLLTVGCIVAIDVAKTKFVAAIATAAGEVLRIVRFEHPRQTGAFLRLLETLRDAQLMPQVVMEPTGTYGDALRFQCHVRNIVVHMMPPKHTHDFAEILDGVPSMHDPKAAVVLARLQAIHPAPRWEPSLEHERDARALLDQRAPISKTLALYFGHLEAMVAAHWPEFWGHVNVHKQDSWMTRSSSFPDQKPSRRQASKRSKRFNVVVEGL